MGKNNDDLEMQTFQIEVDDSSKKKRGKVSEGLLGKTTEAELENIKSKGSNEIVKGLLIGVVVVVAFILLDMFVLKS